MDRSRVLIRFRAEKERSAVHVLIGIATAMEYILQTGLGKCILEMIGRVAQQV